MKSHKVGLKSVFEIFKEGKMIFSTENNPRPDKENTITLTKFKNGIITDERVIPFRSFVTNFARVLNTGYLDIDDSTAGAIIDKLHLTTSGGITYAAAKVFKMEVDEIALVAAAQNNYGIAIGDMYNRSGLGLTKETGIQGVEGLDDYSLMTKILADGGAPDTNVAYDATTLAFLSDTNLRIQRRFANNNVGSIWVNEIALMAKSGTDYFTLARDTITDFEVLSGEVLRVTYNLTISDGGLTSNWLKILSSLLSGSTPVSNPKNTSGTLVGPDFNSARTQVDLLAAADAVTHGILISGDDEVEQLEAAPSLLTSNYIVRRNIMNTKMDAGAVIPIILEQQTAVSGFDLIPTSKTILGMYRDFENILTYPVYVTHSNLVLKETASSNYFLIGQSKPTSPQIVNGIECLIVNPGEILRVKNYFQFNL